MTAPRGAGRETAGADDARRLVVLSNQAARDTRRLDARSVAHGMDVASLDRAPLDWRGEAFFEAGGPGWPDIRVGPVFDRWGELAGRIVVARDVTPQKNLEDERERLVDELQDVVRRVTQLEGLMSGDPGGRPSGT